MESLVVTLPNTTTLEMLMTLAEQSGKLYDHEKNDEVANTNALHLKYLSARVARPYHAIFLLLSFATVWESEANSHPKGSHNNLAKQLLWDRCSKMLHQGLVLMQNEHVLQSQLVSIATGTYVYKRVYTYRLRHLY